MRGTRAAGDPGAGKKNEGSLSPNDFKYIADLVRTEIAVELIGKEYLVESRLAPVARAFNLNGLSDIVTALKRGTNPQLKADVVEAMTTNETSFFRDKHPFETLEKHIIPEVTKRSPMGGLTVWNAASSSGQEPLSLAILIKERFPDLTRPGKAKILATDVSPAMVQRTKEASYSRFEVNRGLNAQQAIEHFQQQGRHWVATPELRNMIEAKTLNLIERWPPMPKCDVVMVRNVLIYFSAEVKRDILQRVRRDVLKPDGYLLLGASESTLGIDDGYTPKQLGPTTVFVPKGR